MSKRNVVIILILALTLFIIGQLTIILDVPDLVDLIASIISLTVFYLFAAPVLAFACTALWQPRINRSVIDDKKKLDDNLYRFIIAMQLLIFILFAAVHFAHGVGRNWMAGYLLVHVFYNFVVFGACLISLLRKSGLVILCKAIITAASLFVIASNIILLVQ